MLKWMNDKRPRRLETDPGAFFYKYRSKEAEYIALLAMGFLPANGAGNKGTNWKSVKQFGHTFSTHGAGAKNTKSLTDRARSTGNNQGQWLDNQKAAEFINSKGKIKEATTFDLPPGMGQKVIIVPSASGVKTAYPIP